MSNLYLIRHGQAGTREHYDTLSDLGQKQSRLLGEYFASQGVQFVAAYSGGLCRQRQTAEGVSEGYGAGFPQITADPGWNEFDLDRIYREIVPQLSASNPDFRRDWDAMLQQVQPSAGAHSANVHRRWLPCDTAVVEAWISGQHEYSGESWEEFLARVRQCTFSREPRDRRANIAAFSSAVPIAIWTGLALDIHDHRIMKLAGAMQNTSITVLQLRDETLRLLSFNATPHLLSSDLRTFR